MLPRTSAWAPACRSNWRDTPRAARAIVRSSASLSVLTGSLPALSWSASHDLLLQRVQEIDRDRKDDRRVLLGGDLGQRLQITQLQRRGVGGDHLCRLGELRRRLELALGVDDLRSEEHTSELQSRLH